jgi:hypothetical protein
MPSVISAAHTKRSDSEACLIPGDRRPKDVTPTLRECLQQEHTMVRPRHFARQPCRPTPPLVKNDGRLTMHGHERASCEESRLTFFTRQPPISPASEMVWWGARETGGS